MFLFKNPMEHVGVHEALHSHPSSLNVPDEHWREHSLTHLQSHRSAPGGQYGSAVQDGGFVMACLHSGWVFLSQEHRP